VLAVVLGFVVAHIPRDILEGMFVVAIGGMVASIIRKVAHGEMRAYVCPQCERPTSRAYPKCRHCGTLLAPSGPSRNRSSC
jgi:ribosomal protein L37AE/L43A